MKLDNRLKTVGLLVLLLSFKAKDNPLNSKIQFEKEFTIINNDTLFFNKVKSDVSLKRIECQLKEKSKTIKIKEEKIIYYYFEKQGIKLTATASAPNWPSMMEVIFRPNPNLSRKMKMFDGELLLFGVPVKNNTTFNELFNNPTIHQLIDYSYYGNDTTNVMLGYFIINTKYASYSVFFDGVDKNSLVTYVNAYL